MRYILVAIGIAAIGFVQGCSIPTQPSEPSASANSAGAAAAHEHHHAAPHGGTLVMLGDHVGQLEFVLDRGEGVLTMYALDGEAENPLRLDAIGIGAQVTVPGKPQFSILLEPVENVLTGETGASSSQYRAQSEDLKGVSSFNAVLPKLSFRGLEMENVPISFPGGSG